jgi:tetratricopeptide (TPR) repeat protein
VSRKRLYFMASCLILTLFCVPANALIPVISTPVLEHQQLMVSRFYYQTAGELAAVGDIDQAIVLLRKAFLLSPGNLPVGLNYIGLVQLKAKTDETEAAYQWVLQTIPSKKDQSIVLYNMALFYEAQNGIEQAIVTMNQALALYPGTPPSAYYFDLGVFYAKMNQYDKTLIYSQKAVEIAPRFSQAWNNLAYSYALAKQFDKALVAIEKAVNLEPDNANALDTYGLILVKLDQYQKAIPVLQKALLLNPGLGSSLYYLGRAYDSVANTQQAITSYQKFLTLPLSEELTLTEKQWAEQRLNALQNNKSNFPASSGKQSQNLSNTGL